MEVEQKKLDLSRNKGSFPLYFKWSRLLFSILFSLGLYSNCIHAQTTTDVSIYTASTDTRDIGLNGVTHRYRSDSWYYYSCRLVSISDTMKGAINGYNTSSTCDASNMDDLILDSSNSNFSGGELIFKGYTSYKYMNTSYSYVTANILVTFQIKVTDTLGNTVSLVRRGKNTVFNPSLNFNVFKRMTAVSPSGARYISGSAGNTYGTIDLFNRLHTDPNSIICTSVSPINFLLDTFTLNINGTDTLGCSTDTIHLEGSSSYNPLWNLYKPSGDLLDTSMRSVHDFPLPSGINVDSLQLVHIASNLYGCRDTQSTWIRFYENPNAFIYSNQDTQCHSGNNFTLSDTNTNTTYTYKWYINSDDASIGYTTDKVVKDVDFYWYGRKEIRLIVTDTQGCFGADTAYLFVIKEPRALLTIDTLTNCLNEVSIDVDASTSKDGAYPIENYQWDLGTGASPDTSSSDKVTGVSYSNAGLKTINLIVSDSFGCSDTAQKSFYVEGSPDIDIVLSDTTDCIEGNSFNFQSNHTNGNCYSCSGSESYFWRFGSDNTSSGSQESMEDPGSVSYTTTGRKQIIVSYTQKNGCKDYDTIYVNVNANPTASLTQNHKTRCVNNSNVEFIGKAINSVKVANKVWTFPSSSTVVQTIDSLKEVKFNSIGNYSVIFKVVDSFGCEDADTAIVDIRDIPTSQFSIDSSSQCLRGNSINLKSTSIGVTTGSIKDVLWESSGASISPSSSSHDVSFKYSSTGYKTFRLLVYDTNGCYDTSYGSVTINEHPTAGISITSDTQCLRGNSFEVSTNNTWVNAKSEVSWSFGSGSTPSSSTQDKDTVEFSAVGSKDIKLIIKDQNGCYDTANSSVEVLEHPVAAIFKNPSKQCINGNKFYLSSRATFVTKSKSFYWTFGKDANKTDATTASVTNIIYSSIGDKQITHIVQDNNGCYDTAETILSVIQNPVINGVTINDSIQCFNEQSFDFSPQVTWSAPQPGSYWWIFTNGSPTSSNGKTPKGVTFSKLGYQSIRFIATDSNSCRDTLFFNINVLGNPSAVISVGYTGPTADEYCLNKQDFEAWAPTKWETKKKSFEWVLGTGSSSSSNTDSLISNISYSSTGTKKLLVIATDDNGCTDTATRNIDILSNPTANITTSDTLFCLNSGQISLQSNASFSSGTSNHTYAWGFGSGAIVSPSSMYTAANPKISYSTVGRKRITLQILENTGCGYWDTAYVNILDYPKSTISVNQSRQCLNNQSFDYKSNVTWVSKTTNGSYSWGFGSNASKSSSSSSSESGITYSSIGTKTATLIVTDSNSCSDTQTLQVVVKDIPTAAVSIDSGRSCLRGNNIELESKSSGVNNNSIQSYTWTSSGASITPNSSSKEVDLSFSSAGMKTYQFVVLDTNGCSDTINGTVTILSHPSVTATVNQDEQCFKGHKFNFSNSTTWVGSSGTYYWDFGSGASTGSSTLSGVNGITYSSVGTKNIQLIGTDANGCKDTSNLIVALFKDPEAIITNALDSQCLRGNSYTFSSAKSTNSQTLTSYTWSFGSNSSPATSTSSSSVNVKYSSTGDKTVSLILVDSEGCSDTAAYNVVIKAHPSTKITVNDSVQCFNTQDFDFDHSTNWATSNSTGRTYSWVLPSQSSISSSTSSKVSNVDFSGTGKYTVTLIVTDANKCSDTTQIDGIEVQAIPVAKIIVDTSEMCLRSNLHTISSENNHSGYNWTFPSGATLSNTTSDKSNDVVFNSTGKKTVQLIAGNSSGCYDTASVDVEVLQHPTASFTINQDKQCLRGNNFDFTSNSTAVKSLSTTDFEWYYDFKNSSNIDENGTSTSSNNYTVIGDKEVRLIIKDQNGCWDTVSKIVTVLEHPQASITTNADEGCFKGHSFDYSGGATWVDGESIHSWTFGPDAVQSGASTQNVSSVIYKSYGIKTAYYIITDLNSCKDTASYDVELFPQATPVIVLSTDSICLKGNQVDFSENSTIPKGSISNFKWEFGDGGSRNNSTASHSYNAAGKYNILLITRTDEGCFDSAYDEVTIHPQAIVWFSIDQIEQCLKGNLFTFTDSSEISSGSIQNYSWNFGDGSIANGTPVNHSYSNEGTYTVQLITQSVKGCLDTQTRDALIYPEPTADFSINNLEQCLNGNQFDFTNNSTVSSGGINYRWDFGDGGLSTDTDPNYSYSGHGSYNIKLVAITGSSCTDTIVKSVDVHPNPSAKFTTAGICKLSTIDFTNNSNIASGSITSQDWDFDDGGTSNQTNPSHVYANALVYKVRLIVESDKQCVDTLVQDVTIRELPTVAFKVEDTCLRNTAKFTSLSNAGEGSIQDFNWVIDGVNQNGAIVNQSFTTDGVKQISLEIINSYGCKSQGDGEFTIRPHPTADYETVGICIGEDIEFNDLSTPVSDIASYAWNIMGSTYNTQNVIHRFGTSGTQLIAHSVVNIWGCGDTILGQMDIAPKVVANFDYSPDEPKSAEAIDFINLSQNATNYSWDFGDGNQSTATDPTHQYVIYGKVWVQLVATNDDGCLDSTSQIISIKPLPLYWVPNAFTPGDASFQLNDEFGLETPLRVSDYQMIILNRWGEKLFESRDLNSKWNGTFQGELVPDGAYTYYIFFYDIDGKPYKLGGTVMVLN